MTLPTLQLTLNGFPNELGAALPLVQSGVDAFKRAFGKARRGLLVVDLFPAHARRIDDITYCYKTQNKRYHLLHSHGLMISSNHQQREPVMSFSEQLKKAISEYTGPLPAVGNSIEEVWLRQAFQQLLDLQAAEKEQVS